ncbi:MAG: trypsin-like peptidase domain-containing protein [Methylophilaceae bacterium]
MRKITFLKIIFLSSLPLLVHAEPNAELAYQLKASIVKVHTATKSGGHGVGTGVVVGKDLVATNCHVIANSVGVKITKFDESFTPDAIKADWKHDLCILKFQFLELKPVELGDSENLKYEQEMFSIGFPGGAPKPQTTYGKIKALYPLDNGEIIRTDASFVMGSSGSPVFDNQGKLIAISTFKSPGHHAYFYNVPVKWVKALLDSPDISSLETNIAPFWDATPENKPFFMQVVLPYQNEKWDELNPIAEAWVNKEPLSAEAHFYLGVANEKLGKTQQAKSEFSTAIKLHPKHAATLFELSIMASKEGNQPELERLKVAIKGVDEDMLNTLNETLNPKSEGAQ